MPRRTVDHNQTIYTISLDNEITIAERNWAVIKGRVIDELTGEPLKSIVLIETETAGLIPRVVNDGLVGFIGIPGRLYPKLKTRGYQIQFIVRANGYISLNYYRDETEGIGPQMAFPEQFNPIEIADNDLALHRKPIVISGRVVEDSGTTITPIAGAKVKIIEIWRLLSTIDDEPSLAVPLNIVSLQPPLYRNREAGTDQLQRREMVPVVGENKSLVEHVSPGITQISLSDRINLNSGNIIVVDEVDADLTEYHTIDTISGSSLDSAPALVTLTHPIAYNHRTDAVVRRVIPQPASMNKQMNRDAIAGDACVFLNNLTGLTTVNIVEIHGGAYPNEYHIINYFSVTTDVDGYFRLPPIHRVAQVKIEVQNGARTKTKDLSLDYTQQENHIDFKI